MKTKLESDQEKTGIQKIADSVKLPKDFDEDKELRRTWKKSIYVQEFRPQTNSKNDKQGTRIL